MFSWIFVTATTYISSNTFAQNIAVTTPEKCFFSKIATFRDQLHEIKQEPSKHFRFPSDNNAFIKYRKSLAATDQVLFFHVENSVIKLLNDKLLKDKQTTAALLNLYKQLFWTNLNRNPVLNKALVPAQNGGLYSDYKSLRLAFRVTDPELANTILNGLSELHRNTSEALENKLKIYPVIHEALKGRTDLSAQPSTWNLAGIGVNPEEAAWAARKARYRKKIELPGQISYVPLNVHNDRLKALVREEILEIEKLRQKLESVFKNTLSQNSLFKNGILRLEIISILRDASTDPATVSFLDYSRKVSADIKARLGVDITTEEVLALQEYFHLVEGVMPSLYIKEGESIQLANLSNVSHGVWSFDLEGAGVKNTARTMRVLRNVSKTLGSIGKQWKDLTVSNYILNELQRGQELQSEVFERDREKITHFLLEEGLLKEGSDRLTYSGDDVTFLPSRLLEPGEVVSLLSKLHQELWPNRVRSVFQPQSYTETLDPIDPDKRLEWVSQLESAQKAVRRHVRHALPDLWKEGVLDRLQVTVLLDPKSPHNIRANVIISDTSRQTIGADVLGRIKREITKFISRNENIEDIQLDAVYELTEFLKATPSMKTDAAVPAVSVVPEVPFEESLAQ